MLGEVAFEQVQRPGYSKKNFMNQMERSHFTEMAQSPHFPSASAAVEHKRSHHSCPMRFGQVQSDELQSLQDTQCCSCKFENHSNTITTYNKTARLNHSQQKLVAADLNRIGRISIKKNYINRSANRSIQTNYIQFELICESADLS